jgi:general stress protein YciG
VKKQSSSSEQVTLQEHMDSIASKGGKARAEKLSPARKKAIGRKGGKVGGRARAESLTADQRAEIARKAAAARWGKKA